MFKILILVLTLFSLSSAQRVISGTCPQIATEKDFIFDPHRFFGKWVMTETTPSLFDFVLRCMEMDYENQKDGTLAINIKGLSFAGLPIAIKGDGVLHDTNTNGNYNVKYSFGVPFQGTILSVIDTDYSEYAVLYSCTNSLLPRLLHAEHIWVLTRSGHLSNPSRQNIYTKLDQLKINRNGLTLSDRNGCPAISTTIREEEIVNVRSNLTNIESNVVVNNVVGSAREEELPTENPIKVS